MQRKFTLSTSILSFLLLSSITPSFSMDEDHEMMEENNHGKGLKKREQDDEKSPINKKFKKDEDKVQKPLVDCSNKITKIVKDVPLSEGIIERDKDGYFVQVISEQSLSKREGDTLTTVTAKACNSRLETFEKHLYWEHDDKSKRSKEILQLWVKRNGEERATREKTERIHDYKEKQFSLIPDGKIQVEEGGYSYLQNFQITEIYECGGGGLRQISGGSKILHLELEHADFMHDIPESKSYHRVNTFAFYNGIRYQGRQHVLTNLPIGHQKKIIPGNQEDKKDLRIYIKPSSNLNLIKNLPIGETLVGSMELTRNGWSHDDIAHRSYRKYTIQGTDETINSNDEWVQHIGPSYSFIPIGLPDTSPGYPLKQEFQITETYTRPDITYYKRQEKQSLNFNLTHQGFVRSQNNLSSYQVVNMLVKYPTDLSDSYRIDQYTIRLFPCSHEKTPTGWHDNRNDHYSVRIYTVTIDPSNAYVPISENQQNQLIVGTVQGEERVYHNPISKWFNPYKWYKIQHSNEEYYEGQYN